MTQGSYTCHFHCLEHSSPKCPKGLLSTPSSSIYSEISFSVTNMIELDTSSQYSLSPFSVFLPPQHYVLHPRTMYHTCLFGLLSRIKFQVDRYFCLFYSLLYTPCLVYYKHPIIYVDSIKYFTVNFNII